MYYRNVLTKIIDGEVYIDIGKLYKFNNNYLQFWMDDAISDIEDERFIEILKSKKIIKETGASCKIVRNNLLHKLHIQLNDTCMCKCEHCYVGENEKKSIPYENVKNIIDQFIDIGVTAIDYSGGEPTLYPDFAKIVSYGKEQGLHQMLFTNGYIKEELYPVIEKNIDIIQISIDGIEEYHNTFRKNNNVYQKAIETLERMKETEVLKYVSMSVMHDNVKYMPYVYQLAKKYGAKFRISPPAPVGRYGGKTNEYYVELIERIKEICNMEGIELTELIPRKPICSAIERTLYVDVNEDVYPCPLLSEKEYNLGNCKRENLEKIICSRSALTIKNKIHEISDERKKYVFFCPAFLFNIDCRNGFFGEVK